jgi:hypothetical protein
MVPLEKVLRKPSSGDKLHVHGPLKREPRPPKEPEPTPPRSFKIVDVSSGQVLGQDLGTRAALTALQSVDSVVDVRIYTWDHRNERWVLLTLGEQKALWQFRQARSPA